MADSCNHGCLMMYKPHVHADLANKWPTRSNATEFAPRGGEGVGGLVSLGVVHQPAPRISGRVDTVQICDKQDVLNSGWLLVTRAKNSNKSFNC